MAQREFRAKVVRVVDGNTVELKVDTGFFNTHTARFRLAGIDAPERNNEARQALTGLLATFGDDWFRVLVDKADPHGGWLATVPLYDHAAPTATVNQRMIELGFVKPSTGDPKP